jgi:hypothetical protein
MGVFLSVVEGKVLGMGNVTLTGRIYQCFGGKSIELMWGFGGGAPKKIGGGQAPSPKKYSAAGAGLYK